MSDNLRQVLEIVGQDQASAELRGVIETLVKLEAAGQAHRGDADGGHRWRPSPSALKV